MKLQPVKWDESKVCGLLREAAAIKDIGERIEYLSGHFLGTPYLDATLSAGQNGPEALVANLEGVDCFTFLDYVEAMRLSVPSGDFSEMLKRVRYRDAIVRFASRNHFFTDWREYNPDLVKDVTEEVGGGKAVQVKKMLNLKEDGTYWVEGIPAAERSVMYIPTEHLDAGVFEKLRTGDYAGIYAVWPGLDVSHVGVIIKEEGRTLLRHASSSKEHRKVVDEDLAVYISAKPGLVILRPVSPD